MPVTVGRQALLNVLEAVRPGLRQKEATGDSAKVAQGDHYAFLGGRVWSMNTEFACHGPTGFPADWEFALDPTRLMQALTKAPEQDFDAELGKGELVLFGDRGREIRLMVATEVKMPVDEVECPEDWRDLPADFGEAVATVQPCAGRNESQFYFSCVHLHPDWLEACDDYHLARYRLKTGLDTPILVRRDALKVIVPLGMTRYSVTRSWVHFRNPSKIIVSCRLYEKKFPDLGDKIDDFRGDPTSLPKVLKDETDFAKVWSSEIKDNDRITVEIEEGRMRLVGVGVTGSGRSGWMKTDYRGRSMRFALPTKVLEDVLTRHNHCEVNDEQLRIDGGHWQYLTVLRPPDVAANGDGKKDEPRRDD